MKNILCYSWRERIRFLCISFLFLLILDWFIFVQFTPLQSYSYDFLLWLGYIVFTGLLFLNGYRLMNLVNGNSLSFFQTFPIRGYQLLVSHFIFSATEFYLLMTPLLFFLNMSLKSALLQSNSSLVQYEINSLWIQATWKTSFLFLLLLVTFYFCIMLAPLLLSLKSKFLYITQFLFFIILITLLYVKNLLFTDIFKSVDMSSTVSLFPLSSLNLIFCLLGVFVFFILDVFLIEKFFSPYQSWR